MKYYPPLPSTFPSETLEAAQDRLGGMYKMHSELPKPAQLAYGPQGVQFPLAEAFKSNPEAFKDVRPSLMQCMG